MKTKVRDHASDAVALGLIPGQGTKITYAMWQKKKKLVMHSEKAMAPHSSTLAWKIPWMEEPGRLQSMGSLRVGHN